MNHSPEYEANDVDHVYPIRYLSEQTGVLTVTLRAWERRYGLLKPQRTEGRHRLYSAQDIARVKAILAHLAEGVPISQVRHRLDRQQDETPARQSVDDELRRNIRQQAARLALNECAEAIYQAGGVYPLSVLETHILRPLVRECQTASQARDKAMLHILYEATQLALWQRQRHLEVRKHSHCLFAGFPGRQCLSYLLACTAMREAGWLVHAAGAHLSAPQLVEAGQGLNASKLVLWVDQPPFFGWQETLSTLSHQWSAELALAGELAASLTAPLPGIRLLTGHASEAIQTLMKENHDS